MTTPIARLELAIKGRTDFVADILKAVFGESEDEKIQRQLRETPAAPELAMQHIVDWVERRQAEAMRNQRKN